MKQISSSLNSALSAQKVIYAKKVLLYLRLWSSEQNSYAQTVSLDITRKVLEISPIKWKLDNEGYSIWNSANASLTLSNADNFFDEGNAEGFLSGGKFLYGSRVEIYGGAQTSQGREFTKIFRGFILSSPVYQTEDKTVTFSLSGELARMSSYSALGLSLTEENELLAQDSGSQFSTAKFAVGEVISLRKGALSEGAANSTLLKAQNDYQVSDYNSYNSGALIKVNTALNEGEALWITYRRWHTDKSMTWIAQQTAQLCQSASCDIEEVLLEGTVDNTFAQPSMTDFSEGEKYYTQESSGSVILQPTFLESTNLTWTIRERPDEMNFVLTGDSVTTTGRAYANSAAVSAPNTQAYGTWEAEASCNWVDAEYQFNYFIASTPYYGTLNGYCFVQDKIGNDLCYRIYRIDGGVMNIISENEYYFSSTASYFKYRISRDGSGNFRLWTILTVPADMSDWCYHGIVATDNTYTTSSYQVMRSYQVVNLRLYNMKASPLSATGTGSVAPVGTYITPVIDGGEKLIDWGSFSLSQTLNDGSGAAFVRSKTSEESSWSAWQSLASGSAPSSAGRYLQLKWEGHSNTAQTTSPFLDSWQINWTSSGVNISVVNTASMTCLDVMEELARLSGYQIGFDAEGTFIFKARSSGGAVYTLDGANVLEVESLSDGSDKLYSRLSINFGSYSETVDDETLGSARPNKIDRYGIKELSLSSGNLLLPQNANLARACAPEVYGKISVLKKRAVVITKFISHLELGDIVNLNLEGKLTGAMRVEGLEFDLERWTLRLDLTEV